MDRIFGVVVVGVPADGVTTPPTDDISEAITSMEVSLTTDMASQVTITVADPGLRMLRANYFQPRQKITYLGQEWEMASVEVRPGNGAEEIHLECRLAGIQKLKRDKGKRTFKEGSATAFAAARAREVGLAFFGETSRARKNISRIRNDQTDESTWDVLTRLAGDNQFWLFEADGRLFFCSQYFLLGKFALLGANTHPGFLATTVNWATNGRVLQAPTEPTPVQRYDPIPPPDDKRPVLKKNSKGKHVTWLQNVLTQRTDVGRIKVNGVFGESTVAGVKKIQGYNNLDQTGVVGPQTWAVVERLASGVEIVGGDNPEFSVVPIEVPNVRKSDDAPEEMSASFRVEREVGRRLRPGMTVYVDGIPGFGANLLVTEVSWREGEVTPVSVTCRTPEVPAAPGERRKVAKRVSLTGGGFADIEATGGFL